MTLLSYSRNCPSPKLAFGGHVAFVEGNPWSITRYAEQRAVDVLAETFGS